jgi:chaperonin GroES
MPDTAAEKPAQGEVLAVGKGGMLKGGKIVPPDVKPGDWILFGKYAGTEIKLEGEELLMMHEMDMIAVLEE